MCFKQHIQRKIIKWRGLRKAAAISRSSTLIRLDLGCGPIMRPGFIGVDLADRAGLRWDLQWGLPFRDNTIEEIRSDHFLEHLSLPFVVALLCECHRVLRPRGRVEFTVPHLDPYIEAYIKRDFDFLRGKIFDTPAGQDEIYSTSFDRIAWLLHRNGEHKSLFDKESILAKFKLAGFGEVRSREHDAEKDVNPRYSSIYIVGVK